MSSINSITAGLYPKSPAKQPGKIASASADSIPSRNHSQNLASSIMADGGLGFLRSRLEEKLESLFGSTQENKDQSAGISAAAFYDVEVNVSPKATAERIVGFALGLMGTYRNQHGDLDEQEMMSGFEAEIRRGISDGFDHARGVLGELELNDAQIEDGVSSTWDWVQKLLDDHFGDEA